MYVQALLSLLCCGLSYVSGAPAPIHDKDVVAIEARGTKYPSVVGRLFNIDGKKQYFAGKPRSALSSRNRLNRFIGTNAWYLGHLTSNADVDQAMSQIAAVSMTFPN